MSAAWRFVKMSTRFHAYRSSFGRVESEWIESDLRSDADTPSNAVRLRLALSGIDGPLS